MKSLLLISGKAWGWSELRHLLVSYPNVVIHGEVETVAEAYRLARACQPDAILCAGKVEGVSSFPVLRELRAMCPAATLVVIDYEVDIRNLARYLGLPVDGYVLWSEISADNLRQILPALLGGEIVVYSRSPRLKVAELVLQL